MNHPHARAFMYLKMSLYILIFSFFSIKAMTKIEKWSDVAPFADKVVAYRGNGDFYVLPNAYHLTDNGTMCGYISVGIGDWLACDEYGQAFTRPNFDQERRWGHILYPFKAYADQTLAYRPLSNFRLKQAHLRIKRVELDEMIVIGLALLKRSALNDKIASQKVFAELNNNNIDLNEFQKTKIA
jgi:hypothetical protein